ncbi:MAG TPA: carboxypeptidase regulatory-like domain-containing protein [Vicinamibacterales bacterium]|nr:carboxypeptidase regulatory-like domain-containing protein [Vicinamibacterales bacterium]
MRRFLQRCAAGLLSILLTTTAAWAQSTAQLSGRITDESDAVLPGATITATQTSTGFVRSDVTDANGAYVLSNLPLGPYRFEVSLSGFRAYVQTGIVLQVGSSPVLNARLSVGQLEESVTVEGAAPLIDVQSAGIREVVRNEEILALPLNGRNAAELVVVSGAAVQTGTAPNRAVPGGLGISVAGGLPYGVAYLLDGAMHNNPQDNLNLPFPFPDALQEFSVATSGLNAQNGMHSGAAVSAVTKSGSNRFSGNAFEFLRDHRFNSTDPFAQIGPDGKHVDDGLQRNQFGGTFGGPVVQNRLFFFGAYQGTTVRQQPAANIAWVPTPAMLAGDFTAFASPACNGGQQITLRGGFADNRIDPARFSPAALNLLKYLPTTTDPCGQMTYTLRNDSNQIQSIGRIDYQRTKDDTIFGRYMATTFTAPIPMREGDTILSLYDSASKAGLLGSDALAQSLAVGDTRVFGPNTVHSLRFAFNRSAVSRLAPATFEPHDLGIDAYAYQPDVMWIEVQGGFFAENPGPSRFVTNASQVSDDLTIVRGDHQLSFGGNVAYWRYYFQSHARSGGVWQFTGDATGRGLSDLLLGRVGRLEHGGPAILPMDQWYMGYYGQDTWRVGRHVTINGGLRWEPYFGQSVLNGAVYNFIPENFQNNVRSKVFVNAPAGLVYPGDEGFATSGRRGVHTQWLNFSPRVGLGWDVSGDGRTAVRASYGLTYDFPNAEYMLINANSPPFGNRSIIQDPPGGFDRPYAHLGGDPHPIATNRDTRYLPFGAYGAIDPDINSPRIQQWNVTVERQLGAVWQVAATYLGSHTDRLWNQVAVNPGVFLGLGPCTLQGVSYPTCSNPANLNARRVFTLSGENPAAAALIGNLDLHSDIGIQNYRGLKLSFQRRAAAGLSMSGNYTVSRCFGDPSFQTGGFPQIANGYTDPAHPEFDRGYCDQDRRHIGVFLAGAQAPQRAGGLANAVLSDWRVSGILTARSGRPVNVIAGQDRSLSGIQNQRVNQVLDNPYGSKQTPNDWLNPAAFALPALGTLGNFQRNSLRAPGYWSIDLAVSRLIGFGATRKLELRAETFNLLNTFNWGPPTLAQGGDRTHTNFSSGAFGRITSMEGTPRIMQFGVKYGF